MIFRTADSAAEGLTMLSPFQYASQIKTAILSNHMPVSIWNQQYINNGNGHIWGIPAQNHISGFPTTASSSRPRHDIWEFILYSQTLITYHPNYHGHSTAVLSRRISALSSRPMDTTRYIPQVCQAARLESFLQIEKCLWWNIKWAQSPVFHQRRPHAVDNLFDTDNTATFTS